MKIKGAIRPTAQAIVFSIICALTAVSSIGQNVEVLSTDFEKGTQKWERRGTGSVSIRTTKKQAASGQKSLRVTGRKENWQGAQLNVTKLMKPGRTYIFSASVKLAKGESKDQVKMTMQIGDRRWEEVAAAKVSDTEWTTFSGKFKPDGKARYLLVYVEAGRARTSYHIDDFKIEMQAPPKQAGTILKNDFEDGTAQNWYVLGANVQMFSAAIGDDRSIKVGARSEPWHGLVLDVSKFLYKGRTYAVSLRVKLVEGEAVDSIKVRVRKTDPNGKAEYFKVAAFAKVTDEGWAVLSGDYTVTAEDSSFIVIVEAEGAKTSYYIDDFELKIPQVQ